MAKTITKDFEKILEAIEAGKPIKAIAHSMNIPRTTVQGIRKKFFDIKYIRKEVIHPAQKSFIRKLKAVRKVVT